MKTDKYILKLNVHYCLLLGVTRKQEKFLKIEKEGPDIVQDVTVTVSPKGLDMLQKVMKNDNKKSKP